MKFLIGGMILLVSFSASAGCYSTDTPSHECRLKSGDSWCLETYGEGYAYDSSCMEKDKPEKSQATSCLTYKKKIINIYRQAHVDIGEVDGPVKKYLKLCYEQTNDKELKELLLKAISDIERLAILHYKLLGKISTDFVGTMSEAFNDDASAASAIRLLGGAVINSEQRKFLTKKRDEAMEKQHKSIGKAVKKMY